MNKATATSPITKEVNGVKMRLARRFLGNLFPTTTAERNELKSYIKGHEQYTFGRELVRTSKGTPMIIPKQHDVRQEYFYTI